MSQVSAPLARESRLRQVLRAIDNRFLAPVLVTSILLIGDVSFGILESYSNTVLAIVTAIVCEVVLGRIVYGRWPHLASAYISGISVGMLVRSPLVWPFIVGSLLSIMSKYVLRWRDRHLWNPSNFGLCALFFLAPATVAALSIQWGNQVWPMIEIWVLGGVILWRLRRLHVCATYVASFVALSFVRSALTGVPWLASLAPMTGPMYQLFIFFMITDPRTTVRRRWAQCVVVAVIAIVEMLLRLGGVVYAPLYALFLVGPPALAFELWWDANPQRSSSA
jgi:Na+-transporting NADH:ubiquinone oxidoreductase subunit NqrB